MYETVEVDGVVLRQYSTEVGFLAEEYEDNLISQIVEN